MKTAEFVSPKHVDKICDFVSDLFVEKLLEQDEMSRVAIETMIGHGVVTITGEVTSHGDIENIVELVKEKTNVEKVVVNVAHQSPEIARGVDIGGAGDQGIMVGYATSETKNFMPLEYDLARKLCREIYSKYPNDGKTQVSVNEQGKIVAVTTSFQNIKSDELKSTVKQFFGTKLVEDVRIDCNPAGDWNIGGLDADTGVTGRKLVIDAYGPRVPVGGGAFSGKDPTKVDRSGAYMARKIAVDYLNKLGAGEVIVYLAYGIGLTEPYQATVKIDGKEEDITGYDLSPKAIIEFLDLKHQKYSEICQWGHFGNNYIWDK